MMSLMHATTLALQVSMGLHRVHRSPFLSRSGQFFWKAENLLLWLTNGIVFTYSHWRHYVLSLLAACAFEQEITSIYIPFDTH